MNNIPAQCSATSILRFLKSRSFSEPKDTKISGGRWGEALYQPVKKVVNRAVKIRFHDQVDEISRILYLSIAKVDTSSNI